MTFPRHGSCAECNAQQTLAFICNEYLMREISSGIMCRDTQQRMRSRSGANFLAGQMRIAMVYTPVVTCAIVIVIRCQALDRPHYSRLGSPKAFFPWPHFLRHPLHCQNGDFALVVPRHRYKENSIRTVNLSLQSTWINVSCVIFSLTAFTL